MNIPKELLYTSDHEWVRLEGDVAAIGVTDFAQGELGDVVFVELPETGKVVKQGDTLGSIEAVKTVAEVFSPLSGEVVEVNSALADKPEMINKEPYTGGWIVKIRAKNAAAEKSHLLDSAAYTELTSV